MPVPVDVIRFAFWREEFMKSADLLQQPNKRIKARGLPEEIQKYDGVDRKFGDEGCAVSRAQK
jgi:hypothetical protein